MLWCWLPVVLVVFVLTGPYALLCPSPKPFASEANSASMLPSIVIVEFPCPILICKCRT